jgi:chemotaxis protein methyltransferase CheR
MLDDLTLPELSREQFRRISGRLYDSCGIALHDGKENLVRSRLLKRLRLLGLPSFEAYLQHLDADLGGDEMRHLIDVLSTNKTHFFRDSAHFDYLRSTILPRLRAEGGPIRIWSAGCSSGEEPHTIAILLREALPNVDAHDARVLGTDVSTRMLAIAKEAVYGSETLAELPADLLLKYFKRLEDGDEPHFRLADPVRRLVSFARLNLQADWPMRGPFDAIFCRNVMIYFDLPTRERLVERFAALLRPGGHLFLGSSESLTGFDHPLRYVQPAVYQR